MPRRIQFRAELPLVRAASWTVPVLRRRHVDFYFDLQGPAAWLEGDPSALERSVQRVLHGAADAVGSGAVFLTAEIVRIGATHCSLTLRCGASGRFAAPAVLDAIVQRLDLVPDTRGADGALHAKGSCPATGAHLRLSFIPGDCALLSLYHLAVGRPVDEPAPRADDARAWLLTEPGAAFESLSRRLQRLGWAVTRLDDVSDALTLHRAFVDAGHARPRLIVATESAQVPLRAAHRLALTLAASARCLFLVDLGSPSLGADDADSPLQLCVAPMSPSLLESLTQELAARADRPTGETVPMPLSEAQRPLALVVDDDPITRLMVANLLAILGLDCAEAEDGIEALERCQVRAPDIVLMDINMPRMNGIEATRALRRRQIRGELPHFAVVMVTSTSDPGARQAGERLAVDGFLQKPLTLEVLRDHVARLVLRAAIAPGAVV